jgi:hypothetical protein
MQPMAAAARRQAPPRAGCQRVFAQAHEQPGRVLAAGGMGEAVRSCATGMRPHGTIVEKILSPAANAGDIF